MTLPAGWIDDDGTDSAWAAMPQDQRDALSPDDPRHGPDGNGRTFRAWGTLPTDTYR